MDEKHFVRPIVSEGEFGYQKVNVAAEERDADSLLGITEKMIRTRKENPAFGFGEWSAFQHDGPCCGSCIDEANEGYSQMYPLCCCRSKMDDDEATALRKRWSEREP